MTAFFEVKSRDGMARAGTFTVGEAVSQTPTALDVEAVYSSLAAMVHANVPLTADQVFVDEYLVQPEEEEVRIVHPLRGEAGAGGCALVANWQTMLERPRDYVATLAALREAVPPDAAWYAPAAALPSNVPFLVYTGFDLFDFVGVDLMTARGLFCTPEGEIPVAEVEEGTCRCAGCEAGDLGLHNRLALLSACATARRFVGKEQLRELVEMRCRLDANQVTALRLIDQEYTMAEAAAPAARPCRLLANAGESMERAEVKRFAARVVERYVPPRDDVAVLLPCSARKPYSTSQSHQKFVRTVDGRAHEVIITSPLGVVPRELEGVYPAGHYDVPVTGYWDREECGLLAGFLTDYLKAHPYGRVIAHLEGGALEVARTAAAACGIELQETVVAGRPTAPASLAALDEALAGERKIRSTPVAGMLAWQFDEQVETKGMQVKGKPWRRAVFKGKTILFNIDPETGLYKPTFNGWEHLHGYRVEIDDFVPRGDVLAPGVTGADPRIRAGDEVLVVGPSAMATGRAAMGAAEMVGARRGVAVKVRKVKSLQHES
ncbi:pseudouridine synthase [Methanofollis formosanus]|uniref:Pseudouridine synthase n=1 Tax=Methanofollis formosanus TaxID=299308 RepID=A0A8G1EFL0_9EURY|nr:archaeosine synthase subunit alpha [Methanofollis formosanus]QYZ77972.1 pseudouridine synthase [Methanofollis formosanus]